MNIFAGKNAYYFLPLFLLILGQAFLMLPNLFFVCLSLGAIAIVFTTRGLAKVGRSQDWSLFVYFPLIFFLSSYLYSTLIPGTYWIYAIFLLNAIFLYVYFKNLYYFFRYKAPERIDKLDTFLMTGAVLSAFFLGACAYGLPIFLGWDFWPLLMYYGLAVFPLFFQPFILGSLRLKQNWPFFLVALVIFLQIAGVIYLFPFGFSVLGLMAAIVFYLLFLTLRLHVRDRLSMQLLRLPLISSLAIFIILLLTTRWF